MICIFMMLFIQLKPHLSKLEETNALIKKKQKKRNFPVPETIIRIELSSSRNPRK